MTVFFGEIGSLCELSGHRPMWKPPLIATPVDSWRDRIKFIGRYPKCVKNRFFSRAFGRLRRNAPDVTRVANPAQQVKWTSQSLLIVTWECAIWIRAGSNGVQPSKTTSKRGNKSFLVLDDQVLPSLKECVSKGKMGGDFRWKDHGDYTRRRINRAGVRPARTSVD